jgi:hypothetical protein
MPWLGRETSSPGLFVAAADTEREGPMSDCRIAGKAHSNDELQASTKLIRLCADSKDNVGDTAAVAG